MNDQPFDGEILDCTIWHRVLTPAEAKAAANDNPPTDWVFRSRLVIVEPALPELADPNEPAKKK